MFNSDTNLMEKWSPVLEHGDVPSIQDKYKKATVARLLENQEMALREDAANMGGNFISEAAAPNSGAGGANLATFDPVLISLVRRAMPNLIAYDIAGVQPMTGPTGLIFAMKSKYSTQGGAEALFGEADTDFSGTGTHQADPTGLVGVVDADTDGSIADTADTISTHGEGLTTAAAERLGVPTEVAQVSNMFQTILNTFYARDCDMVEINPLVMTNDNKLLAADSKITIDSNAFYRQKDIFAQEDTSADDPREALASKWDLNYIHIGGNIGCLVNGAGLAMSTMDIIKLYGGEPANFLDVGGSAVGEALKQAMMLVHDDPEVEAIFVNIFGGILDTHILSKSILDASETIGFTKPIVLRLKGLNSDLAAELFKGREEELGIHYIPDFDTAAQKVVSLC